MSRVARRFGVALGLVLVLDWPWSAPAARPVVSPQGGRPDPATVERSGPAYRYPRAGWIALHVEGAPYERGYQHGRLLAPEIAGYVKALALRRSPKAPADAWRENRTLVNALFLRRYDSEFLEEMKGIADGAAAAGARFEGRPLDLLDVVAVNSEIEVEFLDGALDATPNGLEGRRFAQPDDTSPRPVPPVHCSAFAATGPATADGKVVFGHITMFDLDLVRHFNVWLDLKPARGHRVLMQTFPGGIMSGMDYYLNDAGLLVAETTLRPTRFDPDGQSVASRIRRALQYADSIDGVVAILEASNNGLYTNEWLLADTKTDEIALFELGTRKSKLWRSGRDEWIGGTTGFYWGCNTAKDVAVRLETVASVEGKPANVVLHPSDRDRAWARLYTAHKGRISEGFGFEAFTTPPIAGAPSCDAKFTTSAMARELKTWALFGPPLGRTWEPTESDRIRSPDVRPLVGNDWTVLTAEVPSSAEGTTAPAVDLASSKPAKKSADPATLDLPPSLAAAWHGTLLPRSDADIWLAAAFADYEQVVALEQAIREKAGDRPLNQAERDRLDLALFAPRSRYLAAVARHRGDIPLAEVRSDPTCDEWYQIASGKGVLLLAALRAKLGADVFRKLMDDFGRAHAGQPASTAEFRQAVAALPSQPVKPSFFDAWLEGRGLPEDPGGGTWSINSFEAEPDRAVIVSGTLKEADAQREAAELLQRQIARHWSNVTVPVIADRDDAFDLSSRHILLVGRPDSNAIAARFAGSLPIAFGPSSFVLRGETYAHPSSAVIVAGGNPLNPRCELVLFAGLSAEATRRCVLKLGDRGDDRPAEALLLASGANPRRLVLSGR